MDCFRCFPLHSDPPHIILPLFVVSLRHKHLYRHIYEPTMGPRQLLSAENIELVEARGYRLGAHREIDSVQDRFKYNMKTKKYHRVTLQNYTLWCNYVRAKGYTPLPPLPSEGAEPPDLCTIKDFLNLSDGSWPGKNRWTRPYYQRIVSNDRGMVLYWVRKEKRQPDQSGYKVRSVQGRILIIISPMTSDLHPVGTVRYGIRPSGF